MNSHHPMSGIVAASIAAGPIFVASAALAWLYLTLPQPILIELRHIRGSLLFLFTATIFGFILAFPASLIGAAAMRLLGRRLEVARLPPVWAAVGAAAGCGIAALAGAWRSPAIAFALIATSAICAAICRAAGRFEEQDL